MQKMTAKNKFKILVVDDDRTTLEKTIFVLSKEGYEVNGTIDPNETLALTKSYQPHVVIIELAMLKMDGISICIELRNDKALSNILIIVYTNRNDEYSQLMAFNAGVNDYISKTVGDRILTARVNALLNHHYKTAITDKSVIVFKELTINKGGFRVIKDGKEIILPPKEFKLLMLLLNDPAKIFTRKEISEKVWGNKILPDNRTVDIHIRRLRQKLGDQHIRTVKGIGYGLQE